MQISLCRSARAYRLPITYFVGHGNINCTNYAKLCANNHCTCASTESSIVKLWQYIVDADILICQYIEHVSKGSGTSEFCH